MQVTLHTNQSFYYPLLNYFRFHPKILRISTSLLSSSSSKMLWPQIKDYEDFGILFSLIIDEAFLSSKFFCSISHDLSYHKMLKTDNLLQKITFLITDENQKIVTFAKSTHIMIQCKITANIEDHD